MSNRLLISEKPLQVLPSLAVALGLNQAIVIQQIHYWLNENKARGLHFIDGKTWCYNTFEDWQKHNFPFFSMSTLKRIFKALEKDNWLFTKQPNLSNYDHTKWYSLNYENLQKLASKLESTDSVKLTLSGVSKWPNQECQNDLLYKGTESTTESTTDNTKPPHPPNTLPDEQELTPELIAEIERNLATERELNHPPHPQGGALAYANAKLSDSDLELELSANQEKLAHGQGVTNQAFLKQPLQLVTASEERNPPLAATPPKKAKAVTSYPDAFSKLWESYRKKDGKANALGQYIKPLKEGYSHEQIEHGVQQYSAEKADREPQYIVGLAVLLNFAEGTKIPKFIEYAERFTAEGSKAFSMFEKIKICFESNRSLLLQREQRVLCDGALGYDLYNTCAELRKNGYVQEYEEGNSQQQHKLLKAAYERGLSRTRNNEPVLNPNSNHQPLVLTLN